jgi:hypothetical protein
MPLDDTSVPIPAPNEVFVDRNRYITAKWYPWMVRLFKTLKTTINALDSVQETVDQVAGTWTLSVNSNNRVTGFIKLDGSEVATTFAIMADKLVLVHPSANGTVLQAFTASVVAGVPTIQMHGNVIAPGTIAVNRLIAANLSAISANLGTVTAGKIQSPDEKFLIDCTNKRILALGD